MRRLFCICLAVVAPLQAQEGPQIKWRLSIRIALAIGQRKAAIPAHRIDVGPNVVFIPTAQSPVDRPGCHRRLDCRWQFVESISADALGLSGHLGREKLPSGNINTHAFAADLFLQAGKAAITAEAFAGGNLPMFYSNIKTHANVSECSVEAQSGKGGWGELSFKLNPQVTLNASTGCEEVENGMLKNTAGMVNLMYALQPNLILAGEVGGIKTERQNLEEATNIAANLGCKFNF